MESRIEKIIIENMPVCRPMTAKEIWDNYLKGRFSHRGVRDTLKKMVMAGKVRESQNLRKDMRKVYYVRVMEGETKNAVVA